MLTTMSLLQHNVPEQINKAKNMEMSIAWAFTTTHNRLLRANIYLM